MGGLIPIGDTGVSVPEDDLNRVLAKVAEWKAEDLRAEVARVAAEQDDGQGYGETAWNADTATVFYVCGDWQDPIPITKAFSAIDGVERFASEAEAVPDGWWDTGVEVVYPDPPPRWVTERPAEEATAGVSPTLVSDITATMTMVCVKPRMEEAELIADPDGDPPDILHATLAFLGEVDGDLGHIIEALGPVAASHGPLSGVVGGYGVFSPPGCGIMLPDVPGLAELRQAVAEALHGAGIDFGRDHGWTPHITVDQDPEPEELEEMLDRAAGAPLHFEELLIVRGNTEVVPLRLTGTTPPTAVLTAAGERFCLPSELRLRTDPVYQEFVRTVMRPVLENAGMSFSTSNPLASQLLSQAGSQIVGISQTTQDDVVKVITDAHEQGLSIPDTAKAIREHMDGAANTRATMIARTELSRAANGSALAATKSVSEALGGIPSKTWMTAQGALHPRHEDYPDLDGQTVALDDYFDVGGSQMQYPSDPDGDPAESINCFPGATLVVADNARVGLRRWYRGSLVTVKTDGDHTLAGTPNHPILTNAGWKPLHLIREGDYLVCGSFREEVAITRPDVEHAPTTIKQIVSALAGHNGARRIAGGAMQFHGDGSEGEIEVVTSDRDLGVSLDASLAKPLSEKTLIGANEVSSLATTACAAGQLILARRSATSRDIRSRSEALAIRQFSGGHTNEHRGRSVPGLDTEFRKTEPDYGSANPIVIGQRLLGDAFEVSLAKVVKIDEHAFHGEVFNLETESGAYLANGIIAHNCRCSLSFSGDVGDVSGMDNIDAAAPPHPVRQHNAIVKKAYKRVDELEPRLVAVLEPILRHAGEVAAANFEALATDHLTAAGNWSPPAGEEILSVNCLTPGLAEVPSLADTISVAGQPPVPFATRQQIDHLGLNDWPPHMGTTAQDIFARAGTKETTALYKNASGDYLDSRQALHDEIFDAHFAGKVKPEGAPQAFFTAGGGAAGKGGSTFIVDGEPRTLRELTTDPELSKNFVHVGPDAIKLDLPEFHTMRAAGDPYAAYGVHEESSEIAKAVIDRARAEGYNVIIDQTGKGDSFVAKLESMRAHGYEVQVSMTSIPTNDAIARSVARGLNTEGEDAGRFLAIPLLRQAHAGASRQLAKWANLDWLSWQVFDNSDGRELVAEAHNGAVTVYDQAKYDEILAKANEVQSSP